MKNYRIGQQVRVKSPVVGYYSNYGGKPSLMLTPDMIGTVGAVRVPYVRESRDKKRGDYFVCVDYLDPASGVTERAAVRYDNLITGG